LRLNSPSTITLPTAGNMADGKIIWVENLRDPRLGLFFRVVLFGFEIPSEFL
jgi:hypothetical protein